MLRIYEGYYLELIDGSIWAVKGCCHEENRVAAMPRVINNYKLKDYGSAYSVVISSYRQYLSRPFFTPREIPMVPLDHVRSIIRPLRRTICIDKTGLGEVANEIIDMLESRVGGEWMITGSLLYCLADEKSDIDVVSYSAGSEDLRHIEKLIHEGVFRRPAPHEAVDEAREGLEGMSLGTRVSLIMNGISSLYYKNHRITLKVVRCDREAVSKICSEKKSLREYRAVFEVEDSSEGCLFPYIYKVRIIKPYGGEIREGERLLAYSHRIRYSLIGEGSRLVCIGAIEEDPDGGKYINLDQGFCSLWW